MATAAREEQQHKQPLRAGGKFRKAPFRRTTHSTPYDRPTSTTANGGWISKLVDPAQKLLTYSAHRLFSTVFHKRLPPPSSEANHEARVMDKGEVDLDPPGVQNGAIEQSTGPRATSAGDGGFTLLEQILEQKTFTRPEIDRLKELLHSRTDDIPTENLEKRSEVIPSMEMVSHDRKEECAKTPLQDKSANSRLVSTPVVSSTVPDDDAASPVELAKAYMDNRSSKVSPSLLGLHSRAVYEDSHISNSVAFPSKLSLMSVVPRFSSHGAAPENGFATPRSRGRSAIHSMARTPYSRVQTRSTFKGVGVDTYGAPSSSTRSIWEQSQPSGSKQGALKRRFSVLDNDIGSIGPIRRIRPKPNLLSSRGLSSPLSTEAFQNPSSSTKRPLLLGEPKHTLAKASSENGDNAVPRTCFSTVPSQSSKAASKIFEHLDKINSPKEKSSEPKLLPMSNRSPTKLSPSMLRGQALKSLEDVDSLKFLENPRYKNGNNLDVSSNQLVLDASQKHDNVKENCPSRVLAPCDKSSTVANEVESTTEKKDVMVKVKPAVSAASNTVVHPPEKKRPFKMSAHEYLELDDNDCSINGHVPGSFADGRVQVVKIAAANLEKPIASTEVKPPSSFALNEKSGSRTSDGVYTVAPGATDTVPKPVHTDKADKNNSDAEVPFRVPETLVSSSAAAAAPTSIFSTTSQVSNNLASQSSLSSMAPTANTNSGNNIAATSAVTTSNLFSSVSAPSFSAEPCSKFSVSSATTVTQVPENSPLELLGDKNKQDGGFANLSRTVLPGTSTTSAGTENSFVGVSAAASYPTATKQSGPTFSSGSGSGLSVQASPGLLFKCEPSTASTALTSGSSSLEFLNDKNKQGGSFGTVSSSLFSGTFATSASASSNSFGFSAAASMPTVTSQAPGSSLFSGGSGTGSGTHLSPAGTGVAASTQSAPVQPGSSSSSSVFNFVGNTAFSSGSSALSSSTPSSGVNRSSSTAPSTAFGSGWLPATSSKFASTVDSTSSTPAFQFGTSSASAATNTSSISFAASSSFSATSNSAATVFGLSSASASAPTSNSLPTLFGASTVSAPTTNSASGFAISNGASSTGVFPFTSFATTAASQPAFGNSNPMGFSTAPSGNNDQMSMEDSMAEDTVHALQPTVAAFGQQPVSAPQSTPTFQFTQQPVSTPQTPFVFGGSSNGFPFQSQQNQSNSQNPSPFQPVNSLANAQNPSPFQGSNSLGLPTSSFSLGAPDKSNRRIVKVNRSKNRKK